MMQTPKRELNTEMQCVVGTASPVWERPHRDRTLQWNTELRAHFPPHTNVNHAWNPEPEGHTGKALRWEVTQTNTHTPRTHTAGGRCGGPAHALLSGRAWAGSSRCIWRGFLAGCTRNPGLQNRQDAQAGVSGHRQRELIRKHLDGCLQSAQENRPTRTPREKSDLFSTATDSLPLKRRSLNRLKTTKVIVWFSGYSKTSKIMKVFCHFL